MQERAQRPDQKHRAEKRPAPRFLRRGELPSRPHQKDERHDAEPGGLLDDVEAHTTERPCRRRAQYRVQRARHHEGEEVDPPGRVSPHVSLRRVAR